MNAEQVLTVDCTFNDDPLPVTEIDGLLDAVEHIADQQEGKQLVRCEDRLCDYDVYWNSKTKTVRIAAIVPQVSYEVPKEELNSKRLADFTENA